MAEIIDAPVIPPFHDEAPRRDIAPAHLWERIALGGVLLLSIFMNFFQLGQNGYGNLYYASGVKSMGDSWQNFFFVSYDPGGFVSIDKPPLGFWLQTISTKLFGFTAFSIFLPQALCGVLAVLLLYTLVRRHFGALAGVVAALALAVTPISVVTNRNNTIDATLALALLLAAWAVIHASETGRLRWLLLSAVFVGLGFNIKMAEALLVVPALAMAYLLCAPRKIWTRIWHLLLAGLVMVVLSLSWAVAVDLTPTTQRPYVGSTQTNSEVSLATGYNGLSRLRIGGINGGGRQGGRPAGGPRGTSTRGTGTGTTGTGTGGSTGAGNTGGSNGQQSPFQGGTANQTPNLAETFASGTSSVFRLFSSSLGGQIAWLLPFALFGLLALACLRRPNFQRDRQQLGLVLWGFWLLTMAVFFTLDGSFHQYYMTEMAPGLSALVGIGLVVMWQEYRARGWRTWLLPLALIVTAGAQIYMLQSYPLWSPWLSPLIGVLAALGVVALAVYPLGVRFRMNASQLRVAGAVLSVGLLALMVAPTLWSGYSVVYNTESSFPTAGPNPGRTVAGRAPGGFGQTNDQADAALISYLEANQGSAKFLVATPSSSAADAIILSSNRPVMAMGGFGGGDPILSLSDLQTLIKNGTVRFFLLNAPRGTGSTIDQPPEQARGGARGAGGFGGLGGQNNLTTWVSQHCNTVPTNLWSSTGNGRGGTQLYDCVPTH